jgi:hypothetical protein
MKRGSKENLNFGLTKPNPTRLTSPNLLRQNNRNSQGPREKAQPSKSNPKNNERGSLLKKKPKFWVERNPTLLDSRPQTSSDKKIFTQDKGKA